MTWWAYALISTVLYGLWGLFSKLAVQHIEFKSVLIYDCLVFFVAGMLLFAHNGFKVATEPQGIIYSVLYGITGVMATGFFILAIRQGSATLVTAITAIYPAITMLLAIIVLQESLTLKQGLGLLLAIVGVLLML